MSLTPNIIGHRFGKLVVVERTANNQHGEAHWLCVCDCGNFHISTSYNLIHGKTNQCKECMKKQISESNTKHRCEPRRLWQIYQNMKTRCYNPKYELYSRYGGRGITVCAEWNKSFVEFRKWAFSSGYSPNLTIERVNNDGNYCPENCTWADRVAQANNRHTNRILCLNGESDTLANWARRTSIPYWKLQDRIYAGWSDEAILTTPYVRQKKRSSLKTPAIR